MHICFYEDSAWRNFYPLTCMRPVYSLRAGILSVSEKFLAHFPGATCCYAARDQLGPILSFQNPNIPVNIIKRPDDDLLFINGRIRQVGDLVSLINQCRVSTRFINNGEIVAELLKADVLGHFPKVGTQKDFGEQLSHPDMHLGEAKTTGTLYEYIWQFVEDIEREIKADYNLLLPGLSDPHKVVVHDGVHMVNSDDIYLSDGVTIMPGAVLDATGGPIFIGAHTRINSQAAIHGPCFVGANSVIVAGMIGSCSIGHTCRVGGEVEESIFQSYVNKYHAGFIGHSYAGSWVNFGAMTTNSDLKNNYSNIRVDLDGELRDTGSIKIGSFIGDHTKFGIGTLLNTGIVIGPCSNIFGGTLVTDKNVGSFQWGATGNWQEYQFEKAIVTCRRSCERRHVTMSAHEEGLLQALSTGNLNDEGVMDLKPSS